MAMERSGTLSNPNSITNTEKKSEKNDKKRKKRSEFEFCYVCKLNHDQGQRHKYFPSHKKYLSTFLSRFQTKLADVHFFLKNPTLLRPELAFRNRFWCVFCDVDIDELDSSFACCNAINHLASADHLKNLKHFLWKYGGESNCIAKFRILEDDIAKWEKKCKLSKSEAESSKEASNGPLLGPSNDIHHELNYVNISSFENSYIHSGSSSISNNVMPLQYHTNEYQVSQSELSEVANSGLYPEDVISSIPLKTYSTATSINLNGLTANRNGQQFPADGYFSNSRVYRDERLVKEKSHSQQGLQNLTQIVSGVREEAGGNVHTGAPPPWFETVEESQPNVRLKPALGSFDSSSNQSGKSKKLNPKRVGAAWAEKRKRELEMEKRGELVKQECDANWLPNFGRVWQSGSRKESRKEFESEKQNLLKVESQSMEPVKIQPYISKRMQREANK
ncbi:hypothetical protein UlMin_007685 [Ulmus minor]